jgi:hypothetical protein
MLPGGQPGQSTGGPPVGMATGAPPLVTPVADTPSVATAATAAAMTPDRMGNRFLNV